MHRRIDIQSLSRNTGVAEEIRVNLDCHEFHLRLSELINDQTNTVDGVLVRELAGGSVIDFFDTRLDVPAVFDALGRPIPFAQTLIFETGASLVMAGSITKVYFETTPSGIRP